MRQKGQTLVELIMAVAVGTVIVTAIVAITTLSLRNSEFAKTDIQATRYSQETIEWLRIERDKNWTTLFGKSGVNAQTYCLPTLTWPQAAGPCLASQVISGTVFKREVSLSNRDLEAGVPGNETIEAQVTVTWTDNSGTHESKLSTQLTDWQKQ